MRKAFIYIICIISAGFFIIACQENNHTGEPQPEKIQLFIFSKTNAFRHSSIEPGAAAMKSYFESHDITVTHSEDSSQFNGNGLAAFDVVMFFNTTGNILDSMQQQSLVNHIRSGKGFVGIHAASDTEYDWPWYAGLVGAQFASHPQIQEATLEKTDSLHQSTSHLPERWSRTDEWYNFRQVPVNVKVLLKIDETTYEGGAHGENHPVSWCHEYEGGRSFYTAIGHTTESFQDTMVLRHLLEAVKWAAKKG